jgi:predicted dehydrogenase
VDAVDIVTPPETHYHLAAAALMAGKHVICEKPLTLRSDEARTLQRLASKSSRLILTKMYQRFAESHQVSRRMLRDGTIGTPFLAVFVVMSDNPRILAEGDWLSDPLRGGGVLMDIGIHALDVLQWCFGRAKSVNCSMAVPAPGDKDRVDVSTALHLTYSDGFQAHVLLSGVSKGNIVGSTRQFHGTRGTLTLVEVPSPQWPPVEGSTLSLYLTTDSRRERVSENCNWWMQSNVAAIQSLVDRVRRGTDDAASLNDAIDVICTLEAARESADTRRRVALPDLRD